MNKVSRTEEPYDELDGFNQSPLYLSSDLTINADFEEIANKRVLRGSGLDPSQTDELRSQNGMLSQQYLELPARDLIGSGQVDVTNDGLPEGGKAEHSVSVSPAASSASPNLNGGSGDEEDGDISWSRRLKYGFKKFCSFIGPGFMIAVAYSMKPTELQQSLPKVYITDMPYFSFQLIPGTILLVWQPGQVTNSDFSSSFSWLIWRLFSSKLFALS
jgi:metal iron transporter